MSPALDSSAVPPIAGMHHVALTVTDLARSDTWYQELFYLERVLSEDAEDRRASVFRFPHTALWIGLVEHPGERGKAFDPTTTGLDHVAFAVATRDDLTAWVERLDARGIDHSGVIDIPSGMILNFKDPDGIQLSIFWDA